MGLRGPFSVETSSVCGTCRTKKRVVTVAGGSTFLGVHATVTLDPRRRSGDRGYPVMEHVPWRIIGMWSGMVGTRFVELWFSRDLGILWPWIMQRVSIGDQGHSKDQTFATQSFSKLFRTRLQITADMPGTTTKSMILVSRWPNWDVRPRISDTHMRVSSNGATPRAGWFIREHPPKIWTARLFQHRPHSKNPEFTRPCHRPQVGSTTCAMFSLQSREDPWYPWYPCSWLPSKIW